MTGRSGKGAVVGGLVVESSRRSGEGGAEEVGDQALGRVVEVLGCEHLGPHRRDVVLGLHVVHCGGREARRILAEGFHVRDALTINSLLFRTKLHDDAQRVPRLDDA